jgi:D-glycero-beta-D-manno-heptose 1-phosphate adenylyltransferase
VSLLKNREGSYLSSIAHKQVDPDQLEGYCQKIRSEGKTLVTINGSFDLLHPGHLDMLYRASCQGDFFLVLLNSDRSIKEYKDPRRPINPLQVRVQNMAALEMVDAVSWFDETDPRAVLERVKPDIHANGAEYGEDCIEAEVVKRNGGKIYIIPLIDGYSTTNLIKKIQSICD